jgi:hypothetical protein
MASFHGETPMPIGDEPYVSPADVPEYEPNLDPDPATETDRATGRTFS